MILTFLNVVLVFSNLFLAGFCRHISEEVTERLDDFAMIEQKLVDLIDEREEASEVDADPESENF